MEKTENYGVVSLRWLNGQCYEIRLSNGKVILTDPMISDPVSDAPWLKFYRIPKEYGITPESVERVDYLILNHTHCDHISDVEYYIKKFNPMVICHEAVAYELAKAFDIPFTSVYAVGSEETHEFLDFKMETLHGTHNEQGMKYSTMANILEEDYGIGGPGTRELGHLGGLIQLNFILTTKENFKIAFVGGRLDAMWSRPMIRAVAKAEPNIMIRQVSGRLPENPEQIYADEIEQTGVRLMLPMHHEKYDISEKETLANLIEKTNIMLQERGVNANMVNLVRGRWYQLGISFREI